ncbi:MAG: lipid IV(A) 3-deoxy-D-manno-octulosonic acid transferase [Pseudomonadota bacterium]
MSERWARAALQTYRWAGVAAYPLIGSYIRVRASRGKEQASRVGERYGRPSAERPLGPLVWVHAASLGETSAVIALIRRLKAHNINVVLTTGTVTSAIMAKERLGDLIIHQYVPLDLKPAVSRFLNHWQPDLAVFAESEIWPMTILELGSRRIPQVLINGRMSDRSFQRWHRRLPLAESLFENFSAVAAQSEVDAERFSALGARPVTTTGNLKVDVPVPPIDAAEAEQLRAAIGGRPVWAAISTHEGEEQIAGKVHRALKKHWPDLLTVIVPRHPERSGNLHAMLQGLGLNVALRSQQHFPAPGTDIFLGDTIGEMGLYLRMASVAFVGRSLAAEAKGGQNPLEPAVLDTAILTGPHIANFEDPYGRLIEARAARVVNDDTELAKFVHVLLAKPEVRQAMARAANRVVTDMEGAFERTWGTLQPFVKPLIVSVGLRASSAANGQPATSKLGFENGAW